MESNDGGVLALSGCGQNFFYNTAFSDRLEVNISRNEMHAQREGL
ncbi:hypothetical protein [Pseudomonas sp. SLFW]|nr:hypothetical protein [Pseudomonas sp. SLFW]